VKIPNQVYKNIFDHSDYMIIITDTDLNILDCNQTLLHILGKSLMEVMNLNIKEILPLDIHTQILGWIQASTICKENCKRSVLRNLNGDSIQVCYRLLCFEVDDQKYFQIRFKDISSQKQLESVVTDAEAHFRVLFEQNIVGVAEIEGEKGRFININDKYCRILGYSKAEMLQVDFKTITHPDDIALSMEYADLVISGKSNEVTYEKRYMTKSDQFLWVSVTLTSVKVPGRETPRYFVLLTDISEIIKTKQDLKICEDKLRIAEYYGHVTSWEYYLDTEIMWLTESGFKMWGIQHYTGEMPLSQFLKHVSDPGNLVVKFNEFVARNAEEQVELTVKLIDGSPGRSIITSGEVMIDANGRPVKINGIFHDVTELRQIQANLLKLQEQNLLLGELINRSSQPMAIGNLDNTLGIHNKAFLDLIGYEESDVAELNKDPFSATPSEWHEMEKKKLEELVRTNKPVRYEKELFHKDGYRIPVEYLVDFVKDDNGKPKFFFAFATDLTERKVAQKVLVETLSNFYSMFEQIDVGIAFLKCVRNEKGEPVNYRIIHFNKAYEITTGFRIEDVIEQFNPEFDGEDEPSCWQYYKQVFCTLEPIRFETSSLVKDRLLLVRAYPTEPDTLMTIVKDITESKNMETT
jgi:PAS domain S-box-containing protein